MVKKKILRCSWVFVGITIGFTEFESDLHFLDPKNPDPSCGNTRPSVHDDVGAKKTGGNLTPKNDS